MNIKENRKLLILQRNYQGSIIAITNDIGVLLEKRQFDAWGAILKVQDGAGNNINVLTILDRGYTGHEHLQSVGLINMNGRLYDPKLHRFLQPDNYVQDPSNTQNYNRYGYVLNNPLKYTDESGEEYIDGYSPKEQDNTFPDGSGNGLVKSIYDFFSNKENAEWFARNAGQAGMFIGKNIDSALKDVGRLFKRLFGGGSKGSSGPAPNMASNVNMNPYTPSGSNSFGQTIQGLANDIKDWGSNLGTAAGMTADWAIGTGAENRTFSNNQVASAFTNARVINQARNYWYKEVNAGRKSIYDGLTNFRGREAWTGGNFGLKGLFKAGLDPMEQFVGSFTPEITSNGTTLTYTIRNTTSMKSLFYGIAPDWFRTTWSPGGNMYQTYIFTEPIRFK